MTASWLFIFRFRKLFCRKLSAQNAIRETQNATQTFDFSGVAENDLPVAKEVFETIASILKRPTKDSISIKTNFYDIGGTSLNSISTISALINKGYHISIESFLAAKNLSELLSEVTLQKQNKCLPYIGPYTSAPLTKDLQTEVINMMTISYSQYTPWNLILNEASAKELSVQTWQACLDTNCLDLCFAIKSITGKILGVSLNFDAIDKPEFDIKEPSLKKILRCLGSHRKIVLQKYTPNKKGEGLYCALVSTDSGITPPENVAIITYMEERIVQIAKEKNFKMILASNSNPLTKQLAENVYGYETVGEIQVNQLVDEDGQRPFHVVPDDFTVKIHKKMLN